MFEKNKTFKNAIWIISVRIIQAFLNLLIMMLTARFLGPSNFGTINYAASIVAFAVPMMQLGITNILVQEFIYNPDKEGTILGTAMITCVISSILCIIGISAFALVLHSGNKETMIVCILYSFTLLAQAFELIIYWFQAHLLSKYSSLVSLGAYTVVTFYKVYLLITNKNIYWFALSNTISFLLIAIGLLIFYHKFGGQKLGFAFDECIRMINKGKYYIISGLMITVFSQTDRIMLNLMIDSTATGLYSAAVTCTGMTGFIFVAIIDSVRPKIFESKKKNGEEFKLNMIYLYSIIIYLAFLQSIIIFTFSEIIIKILYGQEYILASTTLKILIWYTAFSYIGAVRNIWILAENKQYLIWKIDVLGAIANVILNSFFIRKYGVNGAAFASLITQIFTNVVVVWLIKEVRENVKMMILSLKIKYLFSLVKNLNLTAK